MSAGPDERSRIAALQAGTAGVQGWLDPATAIALYRLARQSPRDADVVELGAWRGLSLIWLAAGVQDRGGGRVFAVDTWAGTASSPTHQQMLADYDNDQLFEEFRANLARCALAELVTSLRMSTRDAALAWPHGRSIGLLHIDAGHEYVHVREDFELWAPFVRPNGLIVFDDVPSWAGPTRLVSELPPWYRVVGTPPNKWIVQKLG